MTSRNDRPANRLLASLPTPDWERLEPSFTTEELRQGRVLCEAEAALPLIYFPTRGAISALVVMEEGGTIEGLLSGKEGAAGLAAAFGAARSPWRLTVQAPGEALTIAPAVLAGVLYDTPNFAALLFRYAHAMQQLATQSIACNRFHSISERLARWLLLMLDRTDGPDITLTHDFLAQMLGTHRPSVTLALATLEHAGLISRAGRSRIVITDRGALEAAACECYRRVTRELESVFDIAR